MAYTETQSVSWFGRLGSSFRGIGLGIALIIAGTILLWWNEGNFVATGDALNEARAVTQELGDISKLDPSKNGQLVHATGMVETKETLAEPVFGFSVAAIRLERKVEFFQWVEESKSEKKKKLGGGEETVTTYTYVQKWVNKPVDSQQFKDPSAPRLKKNFTLTNLEDLRLQAANVTFGAYQLPTFMINSIGGAAPLNVTLSEEAMDALNRQLILGSQQARPEAMSFSEVARDGAARGLHNALTGTTGPSHAELTERERLQYAQRKKPGEEAEMIHVSGSTVFLGVSPGRPQVGDVRVTFTETKPGAVSLIAKVNGNTFEQFRAGNGQTFSRLVMGTHSLENMYGDAHASNAMMTWILRVAGALLVFLGLKMVVAPLEVFASVIPFLGSIIGAGTGLVSLLLALAWSLVIISIAWLRFRPLIGGGMLAVAGVLIALLYVKGRSRKAAAAQTQTPETVTKA